MHPACTSTGQTRVTSGHRRLSGGFGRAGCQPAFDLVAGLPAPIEMVVRGRIELPTFRFSVRVTLQTTLSLAGVSAADVLAFRGPDADQAPVSDGSLVRGTSYLRGGCPSLAVAGLGLVHVTVGALTDQDDWSRPVARSRLGDLQLGLLSGSTLTVTRLKAASIQSHGITMRCGRGNSLGKRLCVNSAGPTQMRTKTRNAHCSYIPQRTNQPSQSPVAPPLPSLNTLTVVARWQAFLAIILARSFPRTGKGSQLKDDSST